MGTSWKFEVIHNTLSMADNMLTALYNFYAA